MACKICETRRPRRYCPGVGGEICSLCCGTEREATVSCPLDCEYLREARLREKPQAPPREQAPYPDIRLTEAFLDGNAPLLGFIIRTLVETALGTPGAVDLDVQEALDALARTYRTLESGLYYESHPANLIAAAIHQRLCDGINGFRKEATERMGMTTIRDTDVLGVLVFLLRTHIQINNGRKRGRAFLDFLRGNLGPMPHMPAIPQGSPLVMP